MPGKCFSFAQDCEVQKGRARTFPLQEVLNKWALRERGFSSLSGNRELTCCVAWPENYIKKMGAEDFPGGTVDKKPSINAGRRYRFDLWSGKIPHATEQLSLCVTSTEACMPRAHAVRQGKSHHFEKPERCYEE